MIPVLDFEQPGRSILELGAPSDCDRNQVSRSADDHVVPRLRFHRAVDVDLLGKSAAFALIMQDLGPRAVYKNLSGDARLVFPYLPAVPDDTVRV